jgi:hypothetical protein
MFLNLNRIDANFKLVYQLGLELLDRPDMVKDAQALTLNSELPMGFKGTHGLYGSSEWWGNIRSGVIPTSVVVGTIVEIGAAGFPEDGASKTEMHIKMEDGGDEGWTMLANDPQDISLYKVGRRVMIYCAFDERKRPGGRFGKYIRVIVEMAVSVEGD